MPKPEKVQAVAELKEKLTRARSLVLTDFRSLRVQELDALRGGLRKAGAEYHIVKNTLLTIAADEAGVKGLSPYLVGPTAIAIGFDDPVAPAKAVQDFIRQYRKLEVKGGFVEGRSIDAEGVKALADLPSRESLIASVVGGIQGPLYGLVGALSGLQRNLVYALDQIRHQKEAAA
jgi:large subunit ribosomal protein L10